jgi:hypothetical protein
LSLKNIPQNVVTNHILAILNIYSRDSLEIEATSLGFNLMCRLEVSLMVKRGKDTKIGRVILQNTKPYQRIVGQPESPKDNIGRALGRHANPSPFWEQSDP